MPNGAILCICKLTARVVYKTSQWGENIIGGDLWGNWKG